VDFNDVIINSSGTTYDEDTCTASLFGQKKPSQKAVWFISTFRNSLWWAHL